MADYTKLSGYDTAYQQLLKQQQGFGSNATGDLTNRLGAVGDEFTNLFTNMVGRAPTQDELNQFFHQSAGQTIANSAGGLGRSETDSQGVRNNVAQYVGDTFQKQAQDTATAQLKGQQDQANSLADLFRTQGNSAINTTQQSLLDYQSKLFDRLRPNLITSLQSQGLLNTGGMDEAIAGVQGDLANNASQYIAQLQLANQQGANQIAFGGASAPYYFQQGQIANQPSQMMAQAQGALGTNNNTFMSNLDYSHQLGLINAQANAQSSLQPSFLRTLGQSTAQGLGSNLTQWFGPGAGQSNAGGTSGYGGAKMLFA